MKFHHSFISWWLCSAVSKYFHTKTILRMKALSRLLQRSADQWVLFFIWYFFWVFSYLIPFVWLPHTSYLSQAPNAVDFLFPFWSSFYLLCLVTFYLICSHWKVLNIFYSKFKNSRISPVVCQYSLQKNLNTSGDSVISSYDVILLCELWLLVDYNIIKRKVTLILLKHE